MEVYYIVVFFLLLWFQDSIKGLLATMFCLLMTLGHKIIAPEIISSTSLNFFQAHTIIDLLLLALGLIFIDELVGKTITLVSCIAICLNMTPFFISSPEFYKSYVEVYRWLNILLFEVLLWTCITTTIIYPRMKRKSQYYRMR